jgi:hypothetical protein
LVLTDKPSNNPTLGVKMEEIRTCAYCGKTGDESVVGYHSGSYECGSCWNWRKLDGPAARHWFKAAAMFASNVDMHDLATFMPERAGVTADEFRAAMEVANKIYTATCKMLVEHGVSEVSLDGVIRDTYQGMTSVQYGGRDDDGNRKQPESL